MTLPTTCRLLAALILFFVVLTGPAAAREATPASPTPVPTLSELEDIDRLRDLFNQRAGEPRLILLISPT